MKTVSAALDAHLARTSTTLATCWKVTRVQGSPEQVYGFTDHDRNLTIDGVVYRSSTGYTRSAIQSHASLAVDNLDLEGALVSGAITETDIRAGLWDFAAVEIFLVNWADLSMGTIKERKGTLGEVRSGRNHFIVELRGLTQQLQQAVGRQYAMSCDADFGDSRCGFNAASVTFSGSVTSVTDNRTFNDSSRSEATDYYTKGKIKFTGGLNQGLYMDIKAYALSGGAFQLQLPMPFTIQIGDTFLVTAGCRKRFAEDCIAKFNNGVNFRGFPHIPGLDQISSGGL